MSEPAPEERAETIVTWILTDQAVRCLPLKTQEVIATEIRAAILAEQERCVRVLIETCEHGTNATEIIAAMREET
jgi:hypothetical protein